MVRTHESLAVLGVPPMTGVTCPIRRFQPTAAPQKAATMPAAPHRSTIRDRLAYARSRYRRVWPAEAYRAMHRGSLLIDTRDGEQRRRDGLVPGAEWIDRTVLEWRIDPESGATHPAITSLHLPLILLCQQGYSSSLAVASLLDLGATDVTDVEGGFEAWRAAGLPVAAYGRPGRS
jgi:rhodanese-related sulfurtransferase